METIKFKFKYNVHKSSYCKNENAERHRQILLKNIDIQLLVEPVITTLVCFAEIRNAEVSDDKFIHELIKKS